VLFTVQHSLNTSQHFASEASKYASIHPLDASLPPWMPLDNYYLSFHYFIAIILSPPIYPC